MKRLLKGIIDFGKLGQESLAFNFVRLKHTNIQWVHPADEKVFHFVSDFYESEACMPNARVLVDYYTKLDDHEVLERLKDIKGAANYEGANYNFVLKEVVENQRKIRLGSALKEGFEIAKSGLTVQKDGKKIRLEGTEASTAYLIEQIEAIMADAGIQKGFKAADLLGPMAEAAAIQSWQDYQHVKAHPSAGWGVLSGFEPLDEETRGLKPGELWVHAAFTGQMKTTVAETVAYSAVTRYRRNVVYFSLERTEREFRRNMHVLHSSHPKWALQGRRDALKNKDVETGNLSEEEEQFYREVIDDLSSDQYCRFVGVTATEKQSVTDIKRELERLKREMDIGLVVIDYSALLAAPTRRYSQSEELNATYEALRALAIQFDDGRGVPMMVLHQMNRQGHKEAQKTGKYELDALSYANSTEHSAHLITWSYLDDTLRAAERLRFGMMKNRSGGLASHFELHIDWRTKRLTYETPEVHASVEEMTDEEMDEALERV